jgi:hypothetical protein
MKDKGTNHSLYEHHTGSWRLNAAIMGETIPELQHYFNLALKNG